MNSVNRLIRIRSCSNGTTQIEYALLASLFAMVLLPGTQFIGNSANETFIIAGNAMGNSSPGWAPFLGDNNSGPGPAYGSGNDSQGLNNNGSPGLSFDNGGRTEGTVDAGVPQPPPEGGSEP